MDPYIFISNFLNTMEFRDLLELVIEKQWDVNTKAYYNKTLLIVAAQLNDINTVERLLECKANPNIQDDHGSTALNIASEYNNIDIVKKLLEYDSDPNILDNDLDSPLICSSWKNNLEIVKLLLNHQANIFINNKLNKSCICYSFENGLSNKEIKSIYNHDIPIEEIKIEKTNCIICYSQLGFNEPLIKCNNCHNLFCKDCLIEWFNVEKRYNKICPYCKNDWIQKPIIYLITE